MAETVKAERSRILLSLEDTMSKEFRAYYIGKKVEILLEEESKIGEEAYMVGHTREYVKCAVKGGCPNEFVTGQVSGFLTGQILLAETTC